MIRAKRARSRRLLMRPSVLILNAGEIPEPSGTPVEGQDIYFEVLELQPIQLSVSFMRTDRVNADEKYAYCT